MKVRLTRKLAERIDGIDLHGCKAGDVLDLAPREADLIVAEEWAIPERRERCVPTTSRRRADDCGPADAAAS